MPAIESATLITRKPGLLATEVDGDTVLMDVERGQYFGLAKTAQRIWRLLDSPTTVAVLCQSLQRQYAGDAALIDAEARAFIQRMAEESLVTLS